jgi:hypothetical protein
MSVFDPTLQSFFNLGFCQKQRQLVVLAAIEYMLANLYRLVHGVTAGLPATR